MIELLDYILDENDNFWIVNEVNENNYKGYIVYRVSDIGKYNHLTKKYYIKDNDNKGLLEIPKNYKKIFKPREFYLKNKNNLECVWKDYISCLNEIGIKDEYIGIFGSYLIGFDITKDVDFIIYGKDNLHKYYNNIEKIKKELNVTSITKEHIEYQYNKHKIKFDKRCDLKEIISRNWSGIELDNGILSTPRFIDENNTKMPTKKGKDLLIQVKVLEGFYSVMLPRIATVIYNNEEFKIYTCLWKFQSFAHKNDILEIYANVDLENKIIILDEKNHYINYIYKSNEIL